MPGLLRVEHVEAELEDVLPPEVAVPMHARACERARACTRACVRCVVLQLCRVGVVFGGIVLQ